MAHVYACTHPYTQCLSDGDGATRSGKESTAHASKLLQKHVQMRLHRIVPSFHLPTSWHMYMHVHIPILNVCQMVMEPPDQESTGIRPVGS